VHAVMALLLVALFVHRMHILRLRRSA